MSNRRHLRLQHDEGLRILALWGEVYGGGYPDIGYNNKSTEQLVHDGETYLFESPEADEAERTIVRLEKKQKWILIHYWAKGKCYTSTMLSSSTYERKLKAAEEIFMQEYGIL